MYRLIEYSDNCFKTSESLWQYYWNKLGVNNNVTTVDSNEANPIDSFNSKLKVTGQTDDNGECIQINVSLKHLSNFWGTLEIPQINCQINFILAWSANCVTAVSTATANQGVKFAITNTEFYVPVVTLSTHDNAKLPQ